MWIAVGLSLITVGLMILRLVRKQRGDIYSALFAFLILISAVVILFLTNQLAQTNLRVIKQNSEAESTLNYTNELEAQTTQLKNKLAEMNISLQTLEPIEQDETSLKAVYNPENIEAGAQAKMDEIKKRYAEIFVAYYLLKPCEKTLPTDAHVLVSALAQEMASINAPSRLQYDILTSARGSYQELYARTECNAEVITPTESQFRAYVDALTLQYAVK